MIPVLSHNQHGKENGNGGVTIHGVLDHPCAEGSGGPTAITYIPMAKGFVYLVAILNWYLHKVLSWRLSNTLDGSFCVNTFNEAIETRASLEIFDTDQGNQFTREDFTGVLKKHDICVNIYGKGYWVDNAFIERPWPDMKGEESYLRTYSNTGNARASLRRILTFYNSKRRRQSPNR